METQLLFDKLAYVDHLVRAGIDETQARAHAEAMQGALCESVATESDRSSFHRQMRLELFESREALCPRFYP